jgi:hypothetical protein
MLHDASATDYIRHGTSRNIPLGSLYARDSYTFRFSIHAKLVGKRAKAAEHNCVAVLETLPVQLVNNTLAAHNIT